MYPINVKLKPVKDLLPAFLLVQQTPPFGQAPLEIPLLILQLISEAQ
jgi:hypothetical protein